jgi:hypothetical protein
MQSQSNELENTLGNYRNFIKIVILLDITLKNNMNVEEFKKKNQKNYFGFWF